MSPAPALVACFHGTRDPAGQGEVDRLVAGIAARRPSVEVLAGYLGVQQPLVGDVVAGLAAAGRASIVVPVFLTGGYHVHVDVVRAVEAADGRAIAARPVGPDRVLVEILARRLAEAGSGPEDLVVLAGAGSSDPHALADVEWTAQELGRRLGTAVRASYLAAAEPAVADAVAAIRTPGCRVAVSGYLLTAGQFASRLGQVGADLVAAPLLPDPGLADLVLRRYDAARPRR